MSAPATRPWYREPWPWILMAGPAIVVVAGIVTTVLAVTSSDGVVADDYYKQGLGINRVIERDARAHSLGIAAQVTFNEERTAVRVMLASNAPLPETLRLKVIGARSDADQTIELPHAGPALYEGRLAPPRGTRWRLALEDGAATWRVTGEYRSPSPLGEGNKPPSPSGEGRGEGNKPPSPLGEGRGEGQSSITLGTVD